MSSDPRHAALLNALSASGTTTYTDDILAAVDAVDPLRLALRNPSLALVEDIQVRVMDATQAVYGPTRMDIIRILAALCGAVTPDEQ